MPQLTETLLKCKGARNSKVNFKKFMNYTQTYQHRKLYQPNVLGNHVSEENQKDADAACREDMLVLMACWKRHDFKENTCSEEYKRFAECSSKFRAKVLQMKQFASTDELGKISDDGKINPKQTNKLLRMYPQPLYRKVITHAFGHKLGGGGLVFEGKKDDNSQRTIPKNLWSRPIRENRNK